MPAAPALSDALVMFGASGDLAKKQLFRAVYRLYRRGLLNVPVIGVAIDDWTDDDLRARARRSIVEGGESIDQKALDGLLASMTYLAGDYRDAATFAALATRLREAKRPLFHLAIPPPLFADVAEGLAGAGLNGESRLMVEKPFGHDLESAQALSRRLLKCFPEERLYRLDHFLGKEPLRNLLVLRFANAMLEPLWSHEHVSAVKITMAESFDVADRGAFYDATGAVRDVVQNHLLQITSLITMEEPASEDADDIRDQKVAAMSAIQPPRPQDVVRGQYKGYRGVDGVAADSKTETYCALRLSVDTPRWKGVPFLLRTGKALAVMSTEITVEFRRPQRPLFLNAECPVNSLRIPLKPEGPPIMTLIAKEPGEEMTPRTVHYTAEDDGTPAPEPPEAYELLIEEAMKGDQTLFARQDGVEATWRAVDPIVEASGGAVHPYAQGSWGPTEADALAADVGGWPPEPPS